MEAITESDYMRLITARIKLLSFCLKESQAHLTQLRKLTNELKKKQTKG